MVIFIALVGCHDILILGKSPIKWRQCPDMTLAVDWDVKHQFKQTNIFPQQLITSRNEVEELKKKLEQERIDRKVEKQLSQERQEREKGEKSDAEKDSSVGFIKYILCSN